MDVDRGPRRISRGVRNLLLFIVLIAIGGGVTASLSVIVPTEPTIDRQSVLIDTVQRGELVHSVRGVGTLAAEDFLWIPATTEGRVVKIQVRPGAKVTKSTVLWELSNPKLQLAVINAEADVKSAEANLQAVKARLDKELFAMKAKLLELETEHSIAKLTLEINQSLFEQDVVTENTIKMDRLKASGLKARVAIEEQGVDTFETLMPSEYALF
ncbi:MAG: hypothetical protein CMJ78_26460 [Planctomycetaceae bacterium]|nr:hypothetical protein [Planctomycetaceae bacterium]